MIRYWRYVIQPLAMQQGFRRIALYNGSRELFDEVFSYCREQNGILYVINASDFLDASFLEENRQSIALVSSETPIELDCQIILLEKSASYQYDEGNFEKVFFPDCRVMASKIQLDRVLGSGISQQANKYEKVDAIPFGGIQFIIEKSLKEPVQQFLSSELLWNGVEEERRSLEEKLKKNAIDTFTHRSRIYNAEARLRKEELDKVKKEYKEKINIIKNSKRYRIGSKIADVGKVFSKKEGSGTDQQKKIAKGKRFDQLVEMLGISTPEELFEIYLNYSPILKCLTTPLTQHEQTVLEMMEKKKDQDRKRFQNFSQEDLVSVIMPTYNREDIIAGAIASVLKQSYQNFELLVIDDFSTDQTEELIQKYVDDDRVIYTKNSHTKGVCGARNTGLEIARGKYIAYLDTDNEWDEDYLLLSVSKLRENSEYSSVYSAQKICTIEDGELKIKSYRYGMFSISMLENRNYVDINSFVHTRDMAVRYGGFDEELKRMTDWELILRYGRHQIPYSYPVLLCDYFEEGKQENRISDVVDENYSFFASKFNYNKLNLPEAENVIENGYEMYSNADCKVYAKRNSLPAIIIPNYEALGCLKLCIASIRKYTKAFDYEIIIVDNCSSQEVQSYLRRIADDVDIRVIQNDYNMGFTYAVNQGIKAARAGSDYILLNNDAIVTENWLEELYRVKEKVPDAGLIVPRQVLIPQTKTMGIHVPGCNRNREQDVNLSFHHKNVMDIMSYAQYGFIQLNFAAFFMVMITAECYRELGLLDEINGRHYKSDRLYCQSAAEHGIKMIYTPYSKAYHLLQQSTIQLKKNDGKMYDIIFRKNNWDDLKGKPGAEEKTADDDGGGK